MLDINTFKFCGLLWPGWWVLEEVVVGSLGQRSSEERRELGNGIERPFNTSSLDNHHRKAKSRRLTEQAPMKIPVRNDLGPPITPDPPAVTSTPHPVTRTAHPNPNPRDSSTGSQPLGDTSNDTPAPPTIASDPVCTKTRSIAWNATVHEEHLRKQLRKMRQTLGTRRRRYNHEHERPLTNQRQQRGRGDSAPPSRPRPQMPPLPAPAPPAQLRASAPALPLRPPPPPKLGVYAIARRPQLRDKNMRATTAPVLRMGYGMDSKGYRGWIGCWVQRCRGGDMRMLARAST
ncbi:hypothetical protein BD410DRAFT_845157 [Rickenella mellea]|uniref:Uncharacterized protein n=1 Tax=Rickenella mellea TaxID=50990 RepID=A0A4Y7PJF2_9AGAM|nr:hypothetical protein BD410DRAFT_845157 [Rickenella mellea]